MGKSNNITKAGAVIFLQETHTDCPNCEMYEKWAEKRQQEIAAQCYAVVLILFLD